ncbi:hypothetical protein AB1Y20_002912 [Prymnesium parvum]|uniref:F-box domain-containing protein n=1 Tax=Prymnesium parvum TaxID=97485 RepID=A0AB34J9Y2_PRYPA
MSSPASASASASTPAPAAPAAALDTPGDAHARTTHLLELPDELLLSLLSYAADDDYAMLVLPLVCRALRRLCVHAALAACRLASRVRQVVDALPARRAKPQPLAWVIGHAWGALVEAKAFFAEGRSLQQRVDAFEAVPAALATLRTLLLWAAALEPSTPPCSSAEETFLAHEKRRQEALNARSHSLLRKTTSGDDRRLLREEAERQAKRQLDATCRRMWKQMGQQQRSHWQKTVAKAQDQWRRECEAAELTANAARSLLQQLDQLHV